MDRRIKRVITDIVKDLFSFEGRRTRTRFLVYDVACSIYIYAISYFMESTQYDVVVIAAIILQLTGMVVALANRVKRLHDTDNSGWMTLLSLVPLVNIWMFYVVVLKGGDQRKNQYGENPRKLGY